MIMPMPFYMKSGPVAPSTQTTVTAGTSGTFRGYNVLNSYGSISGGPLLSIGTTRTVVTNNPTGDGEIGVLTLHFLGDVIADVESDFTKVTFDGVDFTFASGAYTSNFVNTGDPATAYSNFEWAYFSYTWPGTYMVDGNNYNVQLF